MIFGALQVFVKASYNLKRLLLFYQEYNFFSGSVALFSQRFLFIGLTVTGQVCKWISSAFCPTTVKAFNIFSEISVADPDPHIFWPPGSGSVSVSISQKGTDPDPAPNLDPSIIQQNY
jgi:hypothetical protein